MSRHTNAEPSEAVARYLAEKGEGAVENMQAAVNRAREMLASSEVTAPADGVDPHRPPHPWETTEPRLDSPKRIWLGYVDDYATGEGLSAYFAASFARSEDEFRRSMSIEIGRELADRAEVGEGVDAIPIASMFLSPSFRSRLEAIDRGNGPAMISYLARYRANYS